MTKPKGKTCGELQDEIEDGKKKIRQFGISRIQFREMASNGLIPGVKKASW